MKNVLDRALKDIAENKAQYQNAVLGGNLSGFEEYKHLAGVIRGLTIAESIIKDLVQKLENSDD